MSVVFLHGTLGSRLLGELFEDAARRAGLRLLVPDRPGDGQSASWPERMLTDARGIVAGLLGVCEIDDVRIIGFWSGGRARPGSRSSASGSGPATH